MFATDPVDDPYPNGLTIWSNCSYTFFNGREKNGGADQGSSP